MARSGRGNLQCAASWSAIVSSGIFPTWSRRLSRIAISAIFRKWSGLPSRFSTSTAASVKVMKVSGFLDSFRGGGRRGQSLILCRGRPPVNVEFLRIVGDFQAPGGLRRVIRIRIGEGWASDPEVRAGLRAGSPEPRAAPPSGPSWTSLAVEVDGVDIAAGRTEGPLAEGVLGHAPAPSTGSPPARSTPRSRSRTGPSSSSCTAGEAVALALRRDPLPSGQAPRPRRGGGPSPARRGGPGGGDRLLRPAWRRSRPSSPAAPGASPPPARGVPRTPAWPSRRGPRRPGAPAPGGPAAARGTPACSFEIHDEAGRLSTWRGPGADLASLLVRGRVSLPLPRRRGVPLRRRSAVPALPGPLRRGGADRRVATGRRSPSTWPARAGNATARVTVGAAPSRSTGAARSGCDSLALRPGHPRGGRRLLRRRPAPRARPGRERPALRPGGARRAATLAQVLEAREGDRLVAARRRRQDSRRRAAPVAARPLAPGSLRRVSFRRIASAEVGAPAGDGLFRPGDVARRLRPGADASRFDAAARHRPLERARGALAARGRRPCSSLLRGGPARGARHRDRVGALDPAGAPDGRRPQRPLPPARRAPASSPPGPLRLAIRRVAGRRALDVRLPGRAAPLPPSARLRSWSWPSDSGMVHALDPAGTGGLAPARRGSARRSPVRDGRSCLLCLPHAHRRHPGVGRAVHRASASSRPPSTSPPPAPPLRFAGRIAHRRPRRGRRRRRRARGGRRAGLGRALPDRRRARARSAAGRAAREGARRNLRRARPGRQDALARAPARGGRLRPGTSRRSPRAASSSSPPRRWTSSTPRRARWSGACPPTPRRASWWTAT